MASWQGGGGGQLPAPSFWLLENCQKIFLSENFLMEIFVKNANFWDQNLILGAIQVKIGMLRAPIIFSRKFAIVSQNSVQNL